MTSFDRIPTGRPLTAREFLSVLDPTAAPYIPELHDDEDESPIGVPPRSRESWDVPASEVAEQFAALRRRTDGALAEQRHTVFDLDPDSAFPLPGATCPACPPRTGAAS